MTQTTAQWVVLFSAGVWLTLWVLGLRAYRNMATRPTIVAREGPVGTENGAETMKLLLSAAAGQYECRILESDNNSALIQLRRTLIRARFVNKPRGLTVEMEANFSRLDRLLRFLMQILLYLMIPLVLTFATALTWTLAAPDPNPNVRWQVVQIVQVAHFIWPPFLISFLHLKLRGQTETFMGNVLALLKSA